MARGRPKAALVLSEDERAQLVGFARSRSLPSALSTRAKIILASAEGDANSAIASRLQLNPGTVRKWRTLFIERRINGLYSETRAGKPRSIDDERLAELINTTLHTKPADGSTHWSVRAVAGETGISKTSVHRYFKLFGLQPHRSECRWWTSQAAAGGSSTTRAFPSRAGTQWGWHANTAGCCSTVRTCVSSMSITIDSMIDTPRRQAARQPLSRSFQALS